MSEHIYQNEEDILKKAKRLSDSIKMDEAGWKEEYNLLVNAYDELLGNIIVMTNISDRFHNNS